MKSKKNLHVEITRKAWVLATVMLFACTEDDNMPQALIEENPANAICFGISEKESRSNMEVTEIAKSNFVLTDEEESKKLYVEATTTSGISSSLFKQKELGGRAAPKTNETMYEEFQVLAYANDNLFFDQIATLSDGTYKTSTTYYWPGANYTFDFYAYAPTSLNVTDMSFAYEVPTAAANQQDLLIATASDVSGSYNQAYGLAFNHICTAVVFQVGNEMQNGTIKSITLKNIKNKGTFTITGNEWAVDDNNTADFTQTLAVATTTTTTEGTAITSGETTFIMLPQTLQTDDATTTNVNEAACVEVVFNDGSTDHTLTGTLSGTWTQNSTVTYKISIDPFYDLKFETDQSAIPVKDCHYDIQQLKINTGGIYTGKWAITSDKTWATIRVLPTWDEKNLDLYDQGYWCIDDRGNTTLTGESITTNGIDLLVYLYENTEDTDEKMREVTITLNAINEKNEYTPIATRKIKQYEPLWNGNKAYERIEEYDSETVFPWGFNWSNTKVTFTGSGGWAGALKTLLFKIFQIFGYGRNITMNWNGTASIDMTNIKALGTTASDENNGLQNTKDLLAFDGIEDLNASISLLQGWGMTLDEGSIETQPTNYAVRMILYKNKFNKNSETQLGNTVNVAVLTTDGIEWYLPAPGEVSTLASTAADNISTNNDTPLYTTTTGYWSSQAVANSNTNSYYYISSGSVETSVSRTEQKRVRAARIKPTSN